MPPTYRLVGACLFWLVMAYAPMPAASQCPAGTFLSGSLCYYCPAGRYEPHVGTKGQCDHVCPAGTYSSTGATSCSLCPTGRHNAYSGQSSCRLCTAGRYEHHSGTTDSLCSHECVAGKYSSSTGATSSSTCRTCQSGRFSSAGASGCSACPSGKFSSAGASGCSTCPSGYTSTAGSSSCSAIPVSCAAGSYASGGTCTACASGKYSQAGASTCTLCPTGTTSSAGSGRCVDMESPSIRAAELGVGPAMTDPSVDGTAIAGIITAGVVVLAVVVAFVYLYERRARVRSEDPPGAAYADAPPPYGGVHPPAVAVHVSDALLDESMVHGGRTEIGRGGFGIVYRTKYRLPGGAIVDVAVKELRGEVTPAKQLLLIEEAERLRSVPPHDSILGFMGLLCTGTGLHTHAAIVTEFAPSGSLADYLPTVSEPARRGALDQDEKARIARDVARGLAHLHACTPPMLHLDLKPGNVLLFGDRRSGFRAKICDFGLARSRIMSCSDESVGAHPSGGAAHGGTPRYSDPLQLVTDPRVKAECYMDVFAFGMTMFHLFSEQVPFESERGRMEAHRWVDLTLGKGAVSRPLRPVVPPSVPAALARLIQECWNAQELMRPSAEDVARRL